MDVANREEALANPDGRLGSFRANQTPEAVHRFDPCFRHSNSSIFATAIYFSKLGRIKGRNPAKIALGTGLHAASAGICHFIIKRLRRADQNPSIARAVATKCGIMRLAVAIHVALPVWFPL